MIRANRFDRLGILGLAILDVLGFVQNDGVELQRSVTVGIATDQRVTGDHQLTGRNLVEAAVSVGTIQGQRSQLRRPPRSFGGPVED